MKCWFSEGCLEYNKSMCTPGCTIYNRMSTLLQNSNIPKACWKKLVLSTDVDVEAFDHLNEIKSDIYRWVKEGNNLFIYSNWCGNGKTSWSLKLLMAYLAVNAEIPGNDCRGVFMNIPELFDRERMMMSGQDPEFITIRKNLLECDLVVWDDVACGVLTEYQQMTLLNFLSARELSGKANIFTGNFDIFEVNKNNFEKYVGARLSSRIWQLSDKVKLIGPTRRGSYGRSTNTVKGTV